MSYVMSSNDRGRINTPFNESPVVRDGLEKLSPVVEETNQYGCRVESVVVVKLLVMIMNVTFKKLDSL